MLLADITLAGTDLLVALAFLCFVIAAVLAVVAHGSRWDLSHAFGWSGAALFTLAVLLG